jgi:hypothetical protein
VRQALYGHREEEESELLDESAVQSDRVIKRKGRTLLTDKSTRPSRPEGGKLDKIPEKSFKKTG